MKTSEEIQEAMDKINTSETKYPGMTYEEGVEESLMWVLNQITDDQFEYGKR